MRLNLPIADALAGCGRVLIAGMGGGFDVFCGLPLYHELRARGHSVHLASLSFAPVVHFKDGLRLSETLIGVDGRSERFFPYFPELHLARWFAQATADDVTVWCFASAAVRTLGGDYRLLLSHLQIDALVLVDGGVDGLLRGDEAELGTVLEDACSLTATADLTGLKRRFLACVGLGAEPDVSHAHVFENIAALTAAGAFWGVCALTSAMDAYRFYEGAVTFAHSQRFQDPSVINASVLSAVQGRYGDFHLTAKTHGSRLWISPLMPLYWFFDLAAVAERSLLVPALRNTATFGEAMVAVGEIRRLVPARRHVRVPLP